MEVGPGTIEGDVNWINDSIQKENIWQKENIRGQLKRLVPVNLFCLMYC